MNKIVFTPERVLDTKVNVPLVAVKGLIPHVTYPFQLRDIYPTVPSLNPALAYQRISHEFEQADILLHKGLHLRESIKLPPIKDDQSALSMLGILFNPRRYFTKNIWDSLSSTYLPSTQFLEIPNALPFSFKQASDKKLLHTLAWIDTNIKVNVEQALDRHNLPKWIAVQITQSAFHIYCLLVKQENYRLAHIINFNYSMFLQDRILNLLLGDKLFISDEESLKKHHISNQIALNLVRDLEGLSFRQLCMVSLFMGTIWTNDPKLQNDYAQNPNSVLGDIYNKLFSPGNQIGIDNIDNFFKEANSAQKIAVILDDNGESVFDLAIYQRLLSELKSLSVTFIVNRFPISNNISLGLFKLLLHDSYFYKLRGFLDSNRVKTVYEQQVFRSFERSFISPHTLEEIHSSNILYIKGANFFETMRFSENLTYYAFVVHGEMSATLTGYSEGIGIFARVPRQRSAYEYRSAEHIVTLRDQISIWDKE